MNCPSCKQKYNDSTIIPRLLTLCGHSLCELCLKNTIKQESKVKCLECGTSDTNGDLASYPKNLALLELNMKT
jgi:hypothetical protein